MVIIKDEATTLAFCQAIAQSCCHRARRIDLSADLTEVGMYVLLGALEIDGALPVLEFFTVSRPLTPGKMG